MNNQPLALFVNFHAKPGKFDELKAVLTDMTVKTRVEAGCLQYDLHVNPAEPNQLYFYEQWQTPAHHAAHDLTEHVSAFRAIQDELVERIDFVKLEVLAV